RCLSDWSSDVCSSDLLGEVVSEGLIFNEQNEELAVFRLRLRAWLTRPVLDVRIEIEPKHLPAGYPWHAYYGARFAWRDERTALRSEERRVGKECSSRG